MRWVYGTIRALFLAAIIVGLPWLLLQYGSPLPGRFPRGEDWRVLVTAPDEHTLADIIVIAGWITWAALVWAIIARIVRLAREEPTPQAQRWGVPGPVGAISAFLLGTAATTAVTGTITTTPAAASTPETADAAGIAVNGTYTVRAGDTLWDIADRQLHDPQRWKDIYDLNEHRRQSDGGSLTRPALIRPGWTLQLPGTLTPPNPPPPEPPPPDTPPPTTPPTTTGSPFPQHDNGGFRLPTGAWIAAGLATAIAASVTLARARRRRHTRSGTPTPVTPIPAKVGSILDAAIETIGDPEPDTAGTDQHHAPVAISDLPGDGIGLTGPGAHAAARALLAAHLAEGDRVLISDDDLTLLLPEPTGTPSNLTAGEDTTTALHSEILTRLRDADTHPGHAPGPLLVITSDSAIAAHAGDHAALAITTVVLGPWPKATATVDTDGHVTETTGAALPVARFHHLTSADLAGILATLADTEASKRPPPEPNTAEPLAPAPTVAVESTGALADIGVFGPITVTADGHPIAIGLRTKTRELLAYLAWAHPHGASPATLMEELLPDIAMSKAGNHLRTLIANAREALRTSTGHPEATFITTTAERHGLDPTVVDCDLWRFHTHLNTAAHTTDPTEETRHLTAATAAYQADFATACDGEWADPVRENLRHRTVNAHIRLAELHHDSGNPQAAITSLDTACTLDPLNETLHQRTITAHLAAGRLDAALRLFRTFKTALRDIDEEPDQATYGLFNDGP
ncbi:BTAD domain-containing putative transcriptional regulator [Phytomonospora endophytica]|uniref:DNA-binding SARP family transcriptional activator n=1 Tax=Phytomonospora endophytica TaxID=714109 RepID=A0A841FR47_9ACTN|nr:BTAD domain-containing putative transcriptional regulator [Phytomonospora endophytica]MBB6038526.1 DNA-binding SARP family transcriptional activator [Phytomonospora endophytica]GIG69334.1 hypothetical protein Pen01_56290 [Phytomonospora endophytica]